MTCILWPESQKDMADLKLEILFIRKSQKNMMTVNVMRTFLNRLRDRSWKNINLRGLTSQDIQVLKRNKQSLVCVENIYVDTTVDITPQIDELFRNLVDIINETEAKDVFLPGGGDLLVPPFFKQFCEEHGKIGRAESRERV
jgi:hypothetical protein